MDDNLKSLTLGYVNVSSLALKKAADQLDVYKIAQDKAAAMRPVILQYMVDNNLVENTTEEKTAAEAMLGEHSTSLALLSHALEELTKHRKTAAATPLPGEIEQGKAASASGPRYIGINGASDAPAQSSGVRFIGINSLARRPSDNVLAGNSR